MSDREWADVAQQALARGETVQVRPRGFSMRGRINDGALVTLGPVGSHSLQVGEMVLARVRGHLLVLHQIVSFESGQFEIGTTSGQIDGRVSAADILGRVLSVDENQ